MLTVHPFDTTNGPWVQYVVRDRTDLGNATTFPTHLKNQTLNADVNINHVPLYDWNQLQPQHDMMIGALIMRTFDL